jgi:uroporphyrinogen-III decarboxylase
MPANGWYFDILDATAMSDDIELEDIGQYKARLRRLNDEDLQFAEHQTRSLFETTDKALAGGFMLGGLSGPDSLTFTDWMIALITEKEYVRDLFEAKVEVTLENLRAYRDAVGDRIDIVVVSGVDYGTQRREMFSPNLFEELFVPYYRQINDWIHSNTDWKTFFHSCGSVRGFIEHFIDAGVDILNPVQTTAANMDPAELKNEYGGRIAFWGGGVDTQHVLPFGTPDEVREQVLDRLRVFAPGGGFIFNTAHNVQAKVPTENMMSMYDTVKQRGRYPIVA